MQIVPRLMRIFKKPECIRDGRVMHSELADRGQTILIVIGGEINRENYIACVFTQCKPYGVNTGKIPSI